MTKSWSVSIFSVVTLAAQASSVQASSTQKTQMSTKTVSVTVQPSAVVSSPSNMQSATPSPSQKPTPPLTSAMSSHPAVQTSTPVTPKSTPVRPVITPSRTALMATETVQLNDNGTLCLYARLEVDFEIRYNTTKSKVMFCYVYMYILRIITQQFVLGFIHGYYYTVSYHWCGTYCVWDIVINKSKWAAFTLTR